VPVPFTPPTIEDKDGHTFRANSPDGATDWLDQVARNYIDLRACCATPLRDISLDGIDGWDLSRLKARVQQATIPQYKGGNFDVVRSDFGEVLLYGLLEQLYRTELGYKSVRDRELTQLPGRSIDAVGVEGAIGAGLTLVLGEAKVSDDKSQPPAVVDKKEDSLRNQFLAHLKERETTTNKVVDQARRVLDPDLRDRFFAAALLFEEQRFDQIRVVACAVLVRSNALAAKADYGSFAKKPKDFGPATIRFHRVLLPAAVDEIVKLWHDAIKRVEAA
jgi:hypothetical protein